MSAKPIPDGYSSVTAYLAVDGAAEALEFYKSALGAQERMRMQAPDGKIVHAEISIGNSIVMLADEMAESGFCGPLGAGSTSVMLMVYLENVDAAFSRALEHGAKQLQPVQNQFYGDRLGVLQDPFGHQWALATHVEDVPPEELQRRRAEMETQSDG